MTRKERRDLALSMYAPECEAHFAVIRKRGETKILIHGDANKVLGSLSSAAEEMPILFDMMFAIVAARMEEKE